MTERSRQPTAAKLAAEAKAIAETARDLSMENNRLLRELHAGLMLPQPGYTKSFVQRATEVVIEAEAGKLVGEKFVWFAKVLTAIGTIAAGLYAIVQFGSPK